MQKPIINIENIQLQARPPALSPSGEAAERYDSKMGFIGPQIGAKLLGYNITELPPGKRAFPFHNHRVNEEMFFVLEGQGDIRIGKEIFEIQKGDFVACPPGGEETAHQIINSSEGVLKFLAVSTKMSPEIAEYPDSGKFGILAEFKPDRQEDRPKRYRFVSRETESLDYWEGE